MRPGVWRLEWLRTVRTFRFVAAAAFFVTFGMTGPFMAMYANEIIARTKPQVAAELPPPTPAESVATFVDNGIGLGVLIVVVITAASLALDSRPESALFYRSRVRGGAVLVLPRYAAVTAAMAVAYSLGAWITWYQTAVLIGMPHPGSMALGTGFVVVYLAFATALVALVAALVRSLLAVVGVSAMVLLLLPALALVPEVGPWVPSTLIASQHGLLRGAAPSDYVPALAVACASTIGFLAFAVRSMRRRES